MTIDTITSFDWGEVAILDDEYSENQMKTSSESTAFWLGNARKAMECGGSVPFMCGLSDLGTSVDYSADETENEDDITEGIYSTTKGERKPTRDMYFTENTRRARIRENIRRASIGLPPQKRLPH
jgi:hypothetical protein